MSAAIDDAGKTPAGRRRRAMVRERGGNREGFGAHLLVPTGDAKLVGAGESFGSAVSAAACVSLMPCMSKAREGVMGERAFAKSRNGDERSAALVDGANWMGQDGNGIGNRAR